MVGRDRRCHRCLPYDDKAVRIKEKGGRAPAAPYGLAFLTRTKKRMQGERLWSPQPGYITKPTNETSPGHLKKE